MKPYFTISEFAKLRDMNINSLQYYEKIGILKPAHIDQKTGYRYYTPEQLPLLDAIILCIKAGIPLNQLAEYMDGNEFILNKKLFEKAKAVAQEKIRDIQTGLDKIEYTLRYFDANQQYTNKTNSYERSIIERRFATLDYTGDLMDIKKIEIASGKLYNYAQKRNLSPVFPAGLLIQFNGNKIDTKIFFEIVSKDIQDESIITIPAGNFLCHQIDLTPETDLIKKIQSTFEIKEKTSIIVSNMLLDKFQLGPKKSELQKAIIDE